MNTEPRRLEFDLGPEPMWQTCPCGELSARVPCWSCTMRRQARELAAEHKAKALASIPPTYDATLGSPELEQRVTRQRLSVSEIARAVLASPRVLFVGKAGGGKTSLAVACLRERIEQGMRGFFVSAIRLATARIQHSAGDGEAPIVERAMGADLLLIDDLGQESRATTSAVADVIHERHDLNRATWITTGIETREKLAEHYGQGVTRRIVEGAYIVRLGYAAPRKGAS